MRFASTFDASRIRSRNTVACFGVRPASVARALRLAGPPRIPLESCRFFPAFCLSSSAPLTPQPQMPKKRRAREIVAAETTAAQAPPLKSKNQIRTHKSKNRFSSGAKGRTEIVRRFSPPGSKTRARWRGRGPRARNSARPRPDGQQRGLEAAIGQAGATARDGSRAPHIAAPVLRFTGDAARRSRRDRPRVFLLVRSLRAAGSLNLSAGFESRLGATSSRQYARRCSLSRLHADGDVAVRKVGV